MATNDDVLREVEALGLLGAPRRVGASSTSIVPAIEGEVTIEGRSVTLRVELLSPFPLRLPRFVLRPWDALGVIPHVDGHGTVCFADPEGLVLDRHRPVDIVQEAFERAVQVLADGASGRNHADFADEFEVYWAQLPQGLGASSVLDPTMDKLGEILVASGKDQDLWFADNEPEIAAFRNGASTAGTLTLQRAVYLPLEPGSIIIPPRPDRPLGTAADMRAMLLPSFSDANRTRLKGLAPTRIRRKEYVIARLPRPSGGEALFGLRFDHPGQVHPLLEGGTAKRLRPINVRRLDRAYVVRRGGGDMRLEDKRVLIAGCGAIGGHLSFEMARAGVLDLTLIDHDLLTADNSFRHVLGRRYWGQNKAEALKAAIESELPYVKVSPIAETMESALRTNLVNLSDYDLVALAMGNPTVELDVNARLHELPDGPPGVFAWLEPLGIGGHALLARNGPGGGCFECLYTSEADGEEILVNRAAFAAPGQRFGRALSGCGSLHMPYGSLDAVRTAVLAARLAIDALLGKEPGTPLHSWKGDATAFQAAGFHLAPRHDASDGELRRQRYAYRTVRCSTCGPRDRDAR